VVSGWAQTPVPDEITAEPHYHLLLSNDQVRVFEVVLRATEHAFVRHQYNFLVVALRDSEMVMWNEGESEMSIFDLIKVTSGSSMAGRRAACGTIALRSITILRWNSSIQRSLRLDIRLPPGSGTMAATG